MKFQFLVIVAVMVLEAATVMAHWDDKPEKPVNDTVNVPKKAAPVVSVSPEGRSRMNPRVISSGLQTGKYCPRLKAGDTVTS